MSNSEVALILTIVICVFAVALTIKNEIAIRNIEKQLKDLADNQFDAEQVMKLYEMKYNRPIIMQEKCDVVELMQCIELPYEIMEELDRGVIDKETFIYNRLAEKYVEQLKPFIEYRIEEDYPRMYKVVKARLRVVKK